MKIALIGYGKMGKAIEAIALSRGHEILLKIGSKNKEDFNAHNLQNIDVAIEFTIPETAFENISYLLENNVPTVCGTTAWLEKLEDAKKICKAKNGSFIYASNFSLGVNLFFALNKHLAALMNNYPQYNIKMQEIHHTAKLDSPSGTAVTIANDILNIIKSKTKWVNQITNQKEELGIESLRIDPAPGTHCVTYTSEIDDIEIKHTAHTRNGFAFGAVLAAEYIYNKKGIFTMNDVLGL